MIVQAPGQRVKLILSRLTSTYKLEIYRKISFEVTQGAKFFRHTQKPMIPVPSARCPTTERHGTRTWSQGYVATMSPKRLAVSGEQTSGGKVEQGPVCGQFWNSCQIHRSNFTPFSSPNSLMVNDQLRMLGSTGGVLLIRIY